MASLVGVLVAQYLARPVAALRHGTRAVADGDLSGHVDIRTGDEIEALAADFNAMTDQLRAARERLSAWNEDLAREVERRTGEFHRSSRRRPREPRRHRARPPCRQ